MSEWMENPGYCPVYPSTVVDVRFRDGVEIEGIVAQDLVWTDSMADDDIAYYSIVGENKMINLKELYERGHRRFLFSDGVVREVKEDGTDFDKQPLMFSVPGTMYYHDIWYWNNGEPNVNREKFPCVVGTADGSSQNVNLIRDDNGKWWLEVPQSATVHDITKAAEVLNNV